MGKPLASRLPDGLLYRIFAVEGMDDYLTMAIWCKNVVKPYTAERES